MHEDLLYFDDHDPYQGYRRQKKAIMPCLHLISPALMDEFDLNFLIILCNTGRGKKKC